jgi:ABC-type transport system involved in multi-copper enzyme maturation permease subunit
MSQGRLLAYARWQLFDFIRDRSLALILVGVLISLPLVITLRMLSIGNAPGVDEMASRMVASLASTIITQLAPVFALITINNIVAGDRKHGYYRFLFAKPVSVQRYYAQLFIIHGIGLLLCVTALVLAAHVAKAPIPIFPLLVVFATMYIAMGGIGFLFSVLTRFDWQCMLALWFGALILYERYGASGGIAEVLVHILPPAHVASGISTALFTQQAFSGGQLLWLLLYGAACFGVGVLALRYRQLGS